MASVQRIMTALAVWNRDLPDSVRFDPAKLSVSRESVSVFSHYYQCINMAARPLLFHVVRTRLSRIRSCAGPEAAAKAKELDWRANLSPTTVRVIDICLSAAKDTVHMMSVAAQLDLVATYGFMDAEHIFSAAIVLVMAVVAFPDDAERSRAMSNGLGLLRKMAERGNNHMAARHDLLVRLANASLLDPSREVAESDTTMGTWQWRTAPLNPISPMPVAADANAVRGSPSVPPIINAGNNQPFAHVGLDTTATSLHPSHAESEQTRETGLLPSADAPSSSSEGLNFGIASEDTPLPVFPIVNHEQLSELFFDETTNAGTDAMLWEEGFANPALDVGYDFTRLAHAGYPAAEAFVDLDVGHYQDTWLAGSAHCELDSCAE